MFWELTFFAVGYLSLLPGLHLSKALCLGDGGNLLLRNGFRVSGVKSRHQASYTGNLPQEEPEAAGDFHKCWFNPSKNPYATPWGKSFQTGIHKPANSSACCRMQAERPREQRENLSFHLGSSVAITSPSFVLRKKYGLGRGLLHPSYTCLSDLKHCSDSQATLHACFKLKVLCNSLQHVFFYILSMLPTLTPSPECSPMRN